MARAKMRPKRTKEKVSHVTESPIDDEKSFFKIRTANERIASVKGKPKPKKLFGSFIYEQGLTIFFGNTHSGKTAVAMSIADSIASGVSLNGLEMEAKPQKVIYFDFELSDMNFEFKSSEDYKNHFDYSDNLIMPETNLENMKVTFGAKEIFDHIIYTSDKAKAKIIFIDNISWLEQNGLETTKEANKLMKDLWRLSRNGYAVIILAHTTKKDDAEPMTLSSLAGSAAVSRYLESCFAINKSIREPKTWRYLKQLKNRWGPEEFGFENVFPIIMGIDSRLTFHKNPQERIQVEIGTGKYAQLKDLELKKESSHLTKVTTTLQEREQFVKENVVDGNLSYRQAAAKLNVSAQTINRDVKSIKSKESA